MVEYSKGLSYDDVLLVPKRSQVDSRSDVELSTFLGDGVSLDIPILSAPMDTVTEEEMAVALGDSGGFGTIHRFMDAEAQAEQVMEAKRQDVLVGAAIGIDEDYLRRAKVNVQAGADALMVDVAHAHMTRALKAVEELSEVFHDVTLIAGNVATKRGVADLAHAGADVVKVGVGPGSHCTTRKVTGVGVPQFTAVEACVQEAREHGVRVIADGGIRSSGDAAKALMAGADTVMMGSFFMGTDQAPGHVEYSYEHEGEVVKTHGMATRNAADGRDDKDTEVPHEEGVEQATKYKGLLGPILNEFTAGIRSSLSYCGGHSISQARENAEFIQVSQATEGRNGAHGGY